MCVCACARGVSRYCARKKKLVAIRLKTTRLLKLSLLLRNAPFLSACESVCAWTLVLDEKVYVAIFFIGSMFPNGSHF